VFLVEPIQKSSSALREQPHREGLPPAARLEAKRLRGSSRAVPAICRMTVTQRPVITGIFTMLA
jgi:hypothetical protein